MTTTFGSLTLYPFQERDLSTIRKAGYRALLALGVGGGKTALATAAMLDANAQVVLVVGPDSTFASAWKPTLEKMGGPAIRRIGNGKKADREAKMDFMLGYAGWYFVTPQLLTRDASTDEWRGDGLIIDEAHTLSAAGSKGQRVLSGFSPKDGQPLAQRFQYRLALSGTPARNNFERMWATMRLLWPEQYDRHQPAYDNYHRWLADRLQHQLIYTNQRDRDGNVKTAKKWLGEKQPGLLFSQASCVVQHHRRERCCEFHPNGFLPTAEAQVIKRTVTLLPAQVKAIEELEEQMLAWVEENPLVVDVPLTAAQRVRQLTLGVPHVENYEVQTEEGVKTKSRVTFPNADKSPFADEVEEILDEVGDEPVVVWMASQQFAAALTKRLNDKGYSAFEFSGATKATRDADLAQFGKKYRVLVGVISALGTGTNGIQDICSTEVVIEESLDETENEQMRGRLDRTGQSKQIQRFILIDHLQKNQGAMDERLIRRLALNKSLRVVN